MPDLGETWTSFWTVAVAHPVWGVIMAVLFSYSVAQLVRLLLRPSFWRM